MNESSNSVLPEEGCGPARLPDFTRSAWFLGLMWPLAQAFLLVLHARSFSLIRGEMSEREIQVAQWIGIGSLVHVLAAAACVWVPRLRNGLLRPWGLVAWVLSQVGVLWAFTAIAEDALPNGLPPWLFEPMQVIGWQFMLTMPGLFLALLHMATVPLPLQRGRDVGVSAVAVVGPPLLFFFGVQLLAVIYRTLSGQVSAWIGYALLVIAVVGAALLFWGLFRLLMWAYGWLRGQGPWAARGLVILVALILPLGGLLLNRKISFPFDFQHAAVYVLTVVNALALLVPARGGRAQRWLVWLFQCFTFSFTLYFFLVFVPFFPLAIPAIVAAGAGFLVLTPTALFFVHVARLRESRAVLCAAGVRGPWAALAGLTAFLLLPGGHLAGCWMDRQALAGALEHVYHPDSRQDTRFAGTARALRSLERLRDRKAGVWVPILTPVYHQIAFNGLVLPDAKMQHLYRVLSGRELELKPETRDRGIARELGFSGSWRDRQGSRTTPNLPHNIVWEHLQQSHEDRATHARTTWKFRLRNPGSVQDEFTCQLRLTPGAYVTGLRLKIGEEWVDGQLFEKKAALWIYEMIKTQRQDPALVVYERAREISLRVFPLEAGQVREVEVVFSHPPGVDPVEHSVPKPPAPSSARPVSSNIPSGLSAANDRHQVLWRPSLSAEAARMRQPRIILLLDHSVAGRASAAEWIKALRGLPEPYSACAVDVLPFHHETQPLVKNWKARGSAMPGVLEMPMVSEAGRNLLAAVARALELNRVSGRSAEEFPLLLLASKTPPSVEELRAVAGMLGDAVPDLPFLAHLDTSGILGWFDATGQRALNPQPRPVFLAASGDRILAQPSSAGPVMWTSPAGEAIRPLHVPSPSVTALSVKDSWSGAALLHAWQADTARNPRLAHEDWQRLVQASKQASTLIPETAWMVLERAAHWEKLKRVEGQKLSGDKELGIMETPEPGFWVMLVFLLVAALLRKRLHHPPSPRRQPFCGTR